MRRNSTSGVGALHPFIFFAIIYTISLFLAFFVCSTIYYSLNGEAKPVESQPVAKNQVALTNKATAVVYK